MAQEPGHEDRIEAHALLFGKRRAAAAAFRILSSPWPPAAFASAPCATGLQAWIVMSCRPAVLEGAGAMRGPGRLVLVYDGSLRDELVVHQVDLQLVHNEGLAHGLFQELDLPGRVIAHAEVAHLAGSVQGVEGRGDFLRLGKASGRWRSRMST